MSTYVPLDMVGRIVRYPEHGRAFLRAHRKALAFFAENPSGTLFLAPHRGTPVRSLAEYLDANRTLLDKRINIAGGVVVREPRDGEWPLRRDQRAIEDLLIRRRRGPRGLETSTVRKRFPEIHEHLKESR